MQSALRLSCPFPSPSSTVHVLTLLVHYSLPPLSCHSYDSSMADMVWNNSCNNSLPRKVSIFHCLRRTVAHFSSVASLLVFTSIPDYTACFNNSLPGGATQQRRDIGQSSFIVLLLGSDVQGWNASGLSAAVQPELRPHRRISHAF